jgi:hypothetical protein
VIVADEDWSRGQLGPDYPYYVKNEIEAYALAKAFYEDYAGMYVGFRKWFEEWFRPTYETRFATDVLYDNLLKYLAAYEASIPVRYAQDAKGRVDNDIVKLLAEGDDKELVIFEKLKALADSGQLKSLADKLDPEERDNRGLVWSTPWNDLRMALKTFFSYEDASVKVGHLRKKV